MSDSDYTVFKIWYIIALCVVGVITTPVVAVVANRIAGPESALIACLVVIACVACAIIAALTNEEPK